MENTKEGLEYKNIIELFQQVPATTKSLFNAIPLIKLIVGTPQLHDFSTEEQEKVIKFLEQLEEQIDIYYTEPWREVDEG